MFTPLAPSYDASVPAACTPGPTTHAEHPKPVRSGLAPRQAGATPAASNALRNTVRRAGE
jgi:hypothetical protein